jgi:hypothetical protein
MNMKLRYLGLVMAVLLLAGCNGDNGNGGDSGGEECAAAYCVSSETCVNESICVRRATKEANACEDQGENIFAAVGPAELQCHNLAPCAADADCPQDAAGAQLVCKGGFCGMAAPAGPETVTFRGCVDAFGIGDTTDEMRVALYRYTQDPTGTSSWDVATTTDTAHCEYWGAFEFTDVPTNTPLILKTYDAQNDFVVTYKYNLILWADLAQDEAGTFVFDTTASVADPRTGQTISLNPWRGYAISQTTYDVILMAVSISELPAGHGAIAGTVRDCLYREMENVTCGVVDEPKVLAYMTNASKPRPQNGLDATNLNGIYAAIEIPEGSHRVSCLALDADGHQVPLGEYEISVFDHAVTILSFDWYPGI